MCSLFPFNFFSLFIPLLYPSSLDEIEWFSSKGRSWLSWVYYEVWKQGERSAQRILQYRPPFRLKPCKRVNEENERRKERKEDREKDRKRGWWRQSALWVALGRTERERTDTIWNSWKREHCQRQRKGERKARRRRRIAYSVVFTSVEGKTMARAEWRLQQLRFSSTES